LLETQLWQPAPNKISHPFPSYACLQKPSNPIFLWLFIGTFKRFDYWTNLSYPFYFYFVTLSGQNISVEFQKD